MNKDTRKLLDKIKEDIDSSINALEVIMEEEREKFDNLPESLQNSDKGDDLADAIGNLDNAISNLSEAIDSIEEAQA